MAGDKTIKTWRSKDKLNGIDLVKDDTGYRIETHTFSKLNPKARQTATSYLRRSTETKDAVAEFTKRVKDVTTPLQLNIKKRTVKKILASQKDNRMNTLAKLASLHVVEAGKKKVDKKKRRSLKQITNHLKSQAKKLLRTEARIKEKMESLKKDLEKIKALKVKHRERMTKHLTKVKDKQSTKQGSINPKPAKVPKEDLAKASPKKAA